MSITWKGVMPATLTQFNADLSMDYSLMADHAKSLAEHGCSAIVCHGSLGERATLSFEEKEAFQKTVVGGAFLKHNVKPWDFATRGKIEEAMPLYHWMMSMLRMDTVVKFVQLLKLQQNLASGGTLGNNRVRPPRIELSAPELAEATTIIEQAIATAPQIS